MPPNPSIKAHRECRFATCIFPILKRINYCPPPPSPVKYWLRLCAFMKQYGKYGFEQMPVHPILNSAHANAQTFPNSRTHIQPP